MAYRFERKAKLLTFGEYPQVSLLAARQRRDEAKALIKAGIDPAERKKAERKKIEDVSFRSIALEWHGKETAHCRKKYRGFMLNNLEKYFFPVFGDKPMSEVDADALCGPLSHCGNRGSCGEAGGLQIFAARYAVMPLPLAKQQKTRQKSCPFLIAQNRLGTNLQRLMKRCLDR